MAKELWDALKVEYRIDDVGLDWFAIPKFHKYAMVDSKSFSIQIHDFQDLLRKAELTSYKFSKSYKVQSLVDSLPHS